jgi:hypothetical protein
MVTLSAWPKVAVFGETLVTLTTPNPLTAGVAGALTPPPQPTSVNPALSNPKAKKRIDFIVVSLTIESAR